MICIRRLHFSPVWQHQTPSASKTDPTSVSFPEVSTQIPNKSSELNDPSELNEPSELNAQPGQSDQPVSLPAWDRGGKTKENALTPLLASMRKLIDANKGCVCLVQVGSFYELYFEQATKIAPKLGIKVALRRTSNHTVPMAGFPVSQLQKFVRLLVHDLHLNVAIVDQYPTNDDLLLHRKVSRIVTPGTLVDESFLNYSQNNYLAAVYIPPNLAQLPDPDLAVGISWIDISVGDFYVQQTTLGELAGDLKRISPSEVIMPKEYLPENPDAAWISDLADLRKYFVRYHRTVYRDLKLQLRSEVLTTRKMLEELSVKEEAAMNMVLSYININLPDRNLLLDVPLRYAGERYLHMDSRTRDALELTSRSTFGSSLVVGSLLNTIRRTVTPSGFRLLTRWVKSPILDTDELRRRQEYVALFQNNLLLRLEARNILLRLGDFVRALQRLALKTGLPVFHLQTIGEGLVKLNRLRQLFEHNLSALSPKDQLLVKELLRRFQVPIELAEDILTTLNTGNIYTKDPETTSEEHSDDEPVSLDIYVNTRKLDSEEILPFAFAVKKNHNPLLLKLHDELEALHKKESEFLDNVRLGVESIDPKSVVMRRDQFGRYFNVIHIAFRQKFLEEIVNSLDHQDIRDKRKTLLVYKPAAWAKLQEQRVSCIHDIEAMEKEIINGLRSKVLEKTSTIRQASRTADFLDTTASFAVLAEENDFVAPRFVKGPSMNIAGGRHVVVEAGLRENGQMFNPNDTKLGPNGNLWVISGPNMGGKSTFLRQNALIVILAQIGSFVPASRASIGIVDRIFTRIGAADDLYSDLSTFMVEMIETSNILKNATPRSLAIVDEIGRGTSGKEGLAIAYATLMSLLTKNKCRTLFATHYGLELKNLLHVNGVNQSNIRFMKTKVVEHQDKNGKFSSILFDYSLEEGISDRSYAFEVARLAGFPHHALEHANRALDCLGAPDSTASIDDK